jgi:hypothetical protein
MRRASVFLCLLTACRLMHHGQPTSTVVCKQLSDGQTCRVQATDANGAQREWAVSEAAPDGDAAGLHVTINGTTHAFYGNTVWTGCALAVSLDGRALPDHFVVTDLDGDGQGDLALVANCQREMGPEGQRPFAAGAIYPANGRRSDAVDSVFTQALPSACAEHTCDALPAAQSALHAAAATPAPTSAAPGQDTAP